MKKMPQMGEELLEHYIRETIAAQPTPHVQFTWHGGEPLLRGIDFYHKAMVLQKRYGRGREISNSIQTNGTLLTEEWALFFKTNHFLVGLSLDGPQHCHDHYRTDKGGHGSFERVMAGVTLLQRYEVEFNILAVVNNYNVQFPLEIYRFFKSIGAQYLQFSPIVERCGKRPDGLKLLTPSNSDEAVLTDWSVPSLAYGEFLCSLFDEWVRNDVGRVFVQHFDSTLAGMVGAAPGSCIWAKSCGHAAAMEFNGEVYSCDHYVFPEHKLGNIRTTPLVTMMLSEQQQQFGRAKFESLPRQCRQCRFLPLCNGECPKNRILTTSDGEPGLNYLCTGLQHYFAHVLPYMEYMANELKQQRSPANIMQAIRSGANLT